MDDKHIEFLQQEAKSLRSSADSIPVPLNTSLLMRSNKMKAAAARLRELVDENEVLRAECKAWRRSLVIELSRFPKIRDARAATDARKALEKP